MRVGEHGGVEHDEGDVGGRLGEERREVRAQVARPDGGRFGAGHLDRRVQLRAQVLLAGPHQGVEPGDVVGVVDVERVDVQPARQTTSTGAAGSGVPGLAAHRKGGTPDSRTGVTALSRRRRNGGSLDG